MTELQQLYCNPNLS